MFVFSVPTTIAPTTTPEPITTFPPVIGPTDGKAVVEPSK